MELDLDITDISIRPLREEDSFLCFLAKTNPDSLKYLESVSPPFSSVSESTSWILSKRTSQNDIVLAITYRDLFIGHIGLYSYMVVNQRLAFFLVLLNSGDMALLHILSLSFSNTSLI